ncbi:TfpX/TfpZ family type IV pilin accessory protein [Acinetobacter sichuanensis]|uniref:Type IV pilin accessory protein n=1 Tax=Acinetobacter sichuanensis TaxID=2136183 RepID=A0A371YTB0_9GAMM|nr:TfpX/TfpZ family type IV pilin accessory protein [Acinetobacter sichuanensis]RFC84691.1 type IV pilin accessory protein [Acinetobacter sichuanensis]
MLLKDKIKAFLVHLIVSIFIALTCLAIIYFIWYPEPLYKATGITKIFLLMVGIDIILGPLLTLIIYKKDKKSLKFDLAIIILIQISALIYGVYKVSEGRPIWIVYNIDRFDLIRVNDIENINSSNKDSDYNKFSLFGPQYVNAQIPLDDIKARNQILFDELEKGVSPSQRVELYRPLETAKLKMQEKAQALDGLKAFNEAIKVKKVIELYPQADAWLPLRANAVDMVVLINKEKGEVVKIVDLRPWK